MKLYTCYHDRKPIDVRAINMVEAQFKATRQFGLRDTQRMLVTVRANAAFPKIKVRAGA